MHWKPRTLLLRLALPAVLLSAATGVLLASLPASAGAVPASETSCYGTLTTDPSGAAESDPFLQDYQFNCSTPISAYTVIIDRPNTDGDNVDDYDPNPEVLESLGGTVSTTESVNCGGQTPSNGINCYSLNGSTAGDISAAYYVDGSIDPTNNICSYLPAGAKPGTPAVPRAIVSLVVTDSTGAQDGPFEFVPTTACPKVPAVVPTPKPKKVKKVKPKTKAKAKTKSTTKAASKTTPKS